MKKLHRFTKESFNIAISWTTRKIRSLFRVKDKNLCPACKIYYGIYECGEDYVGEAVRNTTTRWSEHNNPTKDTQPARHLKDHLEHNFHWKIICHASKNRALRKNLEFYWVNEVIVK